MRIILPFNQLVLVTDIYKDGIPKSVQDQIYKKLQTVVSKKKESLNKLRSELDLAKDDLRKAEHEMRKAEREGRAAVKADNELNKFFTRTIDIFFE